MFFIISKVLFFLIQPINWLVGSVLLAFFLKNEKWKKRSLKTAVFIAIFFTNHFIYNQIIKLWEPDPILFSELEESYDVGILLGGFSNLYIEPWDRHNFNSAADRFTHTLELYKLGKIKKVIITGGSPDVMGIQTSEAERIQQFIKQMDFPEEDFIFETESRNTYENAIYTQPILNDSFPNASKLLITSAFHMPRAQRIFKKQNIDFHAFPVDHIGEYTRFAPNSLFIPDRRGFLRWEILIKEWFGIIFYKLRGYI